MKNTLDNNCEKKALYNYKAGYRAPQPIIIFFKNQEKLRTLTVGLLAMKGQYYTNWGAMMAGLTIAALPTLLIYLCFSRRIQESFVAGAVKG